MNMAQPETFRTLGLEITYPYRPYGVQKSMMNHIARTLMNKEHSLVESPTGTGKTLVLLCASLAWLKKSKEISQPYISPRLRKELAAQRIEMLNKKACSCGRRQSETTQEYLDDMKDIKKMKKDVPKEPDIVKKDINHDDDNDVIEIIAEEKPFCKACQAIRSEETFSDVLTKEDDGETDGFLPNKFKSKIPRIYYGTRTHKQISQVIRELNKSVYKNQLRMCILSSRERTCINDEVRDLSNRNDRCQELLKNRSGGGQMDKKKKHNSAETCPYNKDSSNIVGQIFESINDEYPDRGWDIEDATEFGRKNMACTYYGCRSLQESADITFCPYNYLLDPFIRKTLNVNLHNSIIIFDEAHNIEDICRDSASFIIDSRQITDILNTITIAASRFIQGSQIMDAYQYFRDKFYTLQGYLYKRVKLPDLNKDGNDDCVARVVLNQADMRKELTSIGLGPDSLQKVKENLKVLKGEEDEFTEKSSKSDDNQSALSLNQITYLSQLSITLEFLYSNNSKQFDDFRMVVSKHISKNEGGYSNNKLANGNQDEPESAPTDPYIHRLSLLCMNSGIAFERIHNDAWSVLVASGTLSPIESMKTELGCTFAPPFQGGHVIPIERVFASAITHGPNNLELNGNFANSNVLEFQDEVGMVVRDVCKIVPNGVLCFFPSYDRQDKFYQRWFKKGFINQIQRSGKTIYREKKNLSPVNFESELTKYNNDAKRKGALLFAVHRGKVSEGIDFADAAARAVITIGIPYSNVKDVTVGLKKDYNDKARSTRPYLMPGGEWYAAQAFRSLNQAVGRCIRHKEDWGAIIMMDSRLKFNGQVDQKISLWVRRLMSSNRSYSVMIDSLKEFVKHRVREDTEKAKVEQIENSKKVDELSKFEEVHVPESMVKEHPIFKDIELDLDQDVIGKIESYVKKDEIVISEKQAVKGDCICIDSD